MRLTRLHIPRWVPTLILIALTAAAAFAGDWDALGRISKNQAVTVNMRSGQQVKGTIRQVEPESLTLVPKGAAPPGAAQTGGAIRLERANITRVTKQNRRVSILIGAAVLGGATAVGLAFDSSPKSTQGVKAAGILALTGVGAALGAATGHTTTLYEAKPLKQDPSSPQQ